jgi:hypothetical protein
MSEQAEWFYGRGGQQFGPMTEQHLRELARTGQLRGDDLVWRAGMASWQPAANVLAGAFSAGAPGAAPLPPLPQAYPQPVPYASPIPPAPGRSIGDDAGMRLLLPVGRSGWAIAAGYLGLFSVLLIFAPIALVISIIAIMDMRKHPERHGMGRAIFGLVMGSLFSVLLVVMIVAMVSR